MKNKRQKIKNYLRQYETDHRKGQGLALRIEELLRSVLQDSQVGIHLIKCRRKTPRSVRVKVYEKKYKNPARKLTDVYGARIITHYLDDVPAIINILRSKLFIDERNSEDKRTALGLKEFGYKSVHLQASAKPAQTRFQFSDLKNISFEIQVRSILEHVWAEIEHEVVYKSGVIYPDEIKRQFARLSGAIELLEKEFFDLKATKDQLIDDYKNRFTKIVAHKLPIDTARLIALLEIKEAKKLGWRQAYLNGHPFEVGSEVICVKALKTAGVRTVSKLMKVLDSPAYKSNLKKIVKANEIVTHYTLVMVAIATTSRMVFNNYFPKDRIATLLGISESD